MATTPTPTTFQPAFKRIGQQDRHDDAICVIAMLSGKTTDAIFRQAEGLGLPKVGPYHAWIDGDMIAKLLAGNGLVATVWKECANYKDANEVAIVMVDYDADWEVDDKVLFIDATTISKSSRTSGFTARCAAPTVLTRPEYTLLARASMGDGKPRSLCHACREIMRR